MSDNQLDSMSEFEDNYKKMMEDGISEIEDNLEEEVPNEYEELEPSGPTQQDLDLWVKQFPYAKIFKINIIDDMYILRTLNRVEYKSIASRQDLNALTREELIAKTCCLWPQLTAELIGNSGAGVVASIAQFILTSSGFTEPEEVQRLA